MAPYARMHIEPPNDVSLGRNVDSRSHDFVRVLLCHIFVAAAASDASAISIYD
eukprot:CAMPEP_0181105176 /NCGR_PEP_ID=MMETSP1071-20121207/15829_1 /TAXON_ID=35127 /ORGANISM="Thalassiosira sp., Strain NH16" /LENGTH=52 /DNA_ID=CAMNT_0023188439 /DNA_START=268 /DNA_END=426 /DNA_ORIENTATION=+